MNPQAVNEPDFDVFTANTRSILYLTHTATGLPVAFVAIGALLVGSINWTGGGEKGKEVKRGEELGYASISIKISYIDINETYYLVQVFLLRRQYYRCSIPQRSRTVRICLF